MDCKEFPSLPRYSLFYATFFYYKRIIIVTKRILNINILIYITITNKYIIKTNKKTNKKNE